MGQINIGDIPSQKEVLNINSAEDLNKHSITKSEPNFSLGCGSNSTVDSDTDSNNTSVEDDSKTKFYPNNIQLDTILTGTPNIGTINCQDCIGPHVGNTNNVFVQGPVNINQCILEQKKPKKIKGNKKWFWFVIAVAIILIAVVVGTIGILQRKHHFDKSPDDHGDAGENDCKNSTLLCFVSRENWHAKSPKPGIPALEQPSKRVIIAHTDTTFCSTKEVCSDYVRNIQTHCMSSANMDDIKYNFLVGGDCAIYEGRGWDKQSDKFGEYNNKSISIAFIGSFGDIVPLDCQLYATQRLIEEGVKLKKLLDNYLLYGHRQLVPTLSPGLALFNIIKTWKHWTELR